MAIVSQRGQLVLIVLGLILLGFAAGAVIGVLGIERPWIYVIEVVLVLIVVPPIIKYRARRRN
ncbi:hypothetical protein OG205_04790 [Lentzea sp. NBC_00516]|uniref:hypothetical protein n=1 Tax=Lentzea sp. NBC_00516 TaxID=2903582 RepID=UPI002E803A16|nr:hypothetical protein [Lentzea sp. NBC_00516]WUD26329.1 hypothetical protein OG205_04790 [Lentzea sp. NBC_00516]